MIFCIYYFLNKGKKWHGQICQKVKFDEKKTVNLSFPLFKIVLLPSVDRTEKSLGLVT